MPLASESGLDNYLGLGTLFGTFDDKPAKLGFILKVYGILSVQIFIMYGINFVIPPSVNEWSRQNTWILWVPILAVFVTVMVVVYCGDKGKGATCNYVVLIVITFFQSILLAIMSTLYKYENVLPVVFITAFVFTSLTACKCGKWVEYTVLIILLFAGLIIMTMMFLILLLRLRDSIADMLLFHYLANSAFGALLYLAELILVNSKLGLSRPKTPPEPEADTYISDLGPSDPDGFNSVSELWVR